MRNFKYQGQTGMGLVLFSLYVWLFSEFLNINDSFVYPIIVLFIVIGVTLLILWNGD